MEQALSTAPSDLGARPTSATATQAPAPAAGTRLLFIDNIRWVMIMLVLSMHAAVTYSGHGSWYYKETAQLGTAQDVIFLTYQVFLQSFFMGFLFFIAGYFVPGAYDKKGAGRFLRDRAYRLGLPSLLFIFVIQPVACYYAAGVWDTDQGFWGAYQRYILHGRFLSGTGPLWFCVALLFFCLVYAGCRFYLSDLSRPYRRTTDATLPSWRRPTSARPVRPTPFPRAILVAG
ncbi:MAG TPA: acyltransferase family protein, partial [Puia sp.]|nr:acyltransferase family protein [Puia sp.]